MQNEQPKHKLRILLNTDGVWCGSGYAVQAEQFGFRIKKAGYDIGFVNLYGLEGGVLKLNDVMMYPKLAGGSAWGEDALLMHAQLFKPDVSMILKDIWTMNPDILKQIKRLIPILPVDHDPVARIVMEKAILSYRIIAYSKFGVDQLRKKGLSSTYIPHSVETTIFKPIEGKERLRKKYNLPPDLFIFGMVSANKDNPPRKSFQQAIDAFAMFYKKYPNSAMYFHTDIHPPGGFPIDEYWEFIGLPKDRMFFLQVYDRAFKVGRVEMAEIYNCFDCLMAPSANEGFGVPIVEAQSCGIPVITTDFTAMPELIIPGETGYLCKVGTKRFDQLGSYVAVPDVNSIYNCMMEIYKRNRVKMGEKARKWVVENYDADLVFNKYWLSFLSILEKEIYG